MLWISARVGAVRGSAQGGVWTCCWPCTKVVCGTAAQAAHTAWLGVHLAGTHSVEDWMAQAADAHCGHFSPPFLSAVGLHFWLGHGVVCAQLPQPAQHGLGTEGC